MASAYVITQILNDIQSIDKNLACIQHFQAELEKCDKKERARIYGMLAGQGEKLPETVLNSTAFYLTAHRKILQHAIDTTAVKWPPDIAQAD